MLRRHSLERRLFGWLLALALLPPLLVFGAAVLVGAGWLEWIGTLGPWERVADSGRAVFDAAQPAIAADPSLGAAVAQHERVLSESLVQAGRWQFLGERVTALLPVAVAIIGLVLVAAAFWVSRRLARELARPIRDLVQWAEHLARDEALPAEDPAERGEVEEVRALRGGLRRASTQLAEGRTKALEAERLRAWGDLARRVAHEMKNPLTPLRLAAHRLARIEAPDPAIAEAVTVIGEESGRLDELARQFSALGSPFTGPRSEVDLEEMLGELLASDVPPTIRTSLRVDGVTTRIEAHHDAILRAFRNLLRNAVESLGSGGRIDVVLRTHDAGIEVVVADDGPGVPVELLERIFEPDFTRKAGGTGLGLTLVRQAVAAHGGEVRARSREGGGAEFVVRLPASGSPSEVGV
jgi:signal transduction histidine kinase